MVQYHKNLSHLGGFIMTKQKNENKCDRIPINYLGALCCVCIFGVVWYVAPSIESSERILVYFMYAGIAYGSLGCFWNYRLDENGITRYFLGFKDRQLLWKNVESVGILYSTTYAKGSGQKYIVMIPEYCELPDLNQYNGLDYMRRNRKRIMKRSCNRKYIEFVEKYYGPVDFGKVSP